MSHVFDRMRRNGQAACAAVQRVPRLLASGRVNPDKRRLLVEAIERNRREIDAIAIELSATNAEPRLLDLAGKINGLWIALAEMATVEWIDQDARRVA